MVDEPPINPPLKGERINKKLIQGDAHRTLFEFKRVILS